MSGGVAHWDEIEPRPMGGELLRGARGRFGPAMGAVRAGLSRYDLGPHERAMPLHAHFDEEEIAFVLRGSGVTTDGTRAWAIGLDDTVVWAPGSPAHTVVAGADGITLLIFATGSDTHLTWLPRAKTLWAGTRWIPVDGPHPFAAEEAAGPLELPVPEPDRPSHVVALAAVEVGERAFSDVVSDRRRVGAAAGARRSGLTHAVVAAGAHSSLPHAHSAEEELFVVLAGGGTLRLFDKDARVLEEHPVRPGSLVGRPPATGVAHAFQAGDDGLTLLGYSRDDPNDMCFYPRSQTLAFNAFDVVVRVEQVADADGEPSPGS